MERINKHRFELTTRDFRNLGSSLEEVLLSISEKDYGEYKIDNSNIRLILALRIAEGMNEWQCRTNKGIELRGTFNVSLNIFDKSEMQKKIEAAMDSFEI